MSIEQRFADLEARVEKLEAAEQATAQIIINELKRRGINL
ncbi:hypothetical protein DFP93_102157 [Aneurinibacillus soli]|uniref:Uncharacterized protein n=1 Tax=Aneurinibacillus soli TaxID=1500254 RepID=A0A0U5AV20_9BACL|nr:hypothetical protein DFP93_102157 [Aneurinibacillus soli]BAU27594.1 hypothetical protein CB4_01768 [Aneurinibacillus soli]